MGGGDDINDLKGMRCKCPLNSCPPAIELTTGKIVKGSDVLYLSCSDARINWGIECCGPQGDWFKPLLEPSDL